MGNCHNYTKKNGGGQTSQSLTIQFCIRVILRAVVYTFTCGKKVPNNKYIYTSLISSILHVDHDSLVVLPVDIKQCIEYATSITLDMQSVDQ